MMNKKGVTLIELVVVFVIIAIGAVLIAPNIGAWLPRYRLRSATRDIASMMRTAQMKAVTTNMDYQVFFIGTGSYILRRNTGGWVDEGALQTLPSGITFNTNFNPINEAIFRPNATSNGGRVVVQDPKGNQRTITVLFTTGRISVNP